MFFFFFVIVNNVFFPLWIYRLVKSLCHNIQGRRTMDLPQSDSGLFSLGFVYLHASSFPFLMVNIFINKSTFSGILIMALSEISRDS